MGDPLLSLLECVLTPAHISYSVPTEAMIREPSHRNSWGVSSQACQGADDRCLCTGMHRAMLRLVASAATNVSNHPVHKEEHVAVRA